MTRKTSQLSREWNTPSTTWVPTTYPWLQSNCNTKNRILSKEIGSTFVLMSQDAQLVRFHWRICGHFVLWTHNWILWLFRGCSTRKEVPSQQWWHRNGLMLRHLKWGGRKATWKCEHFEEVSCRWLSRFRNEVIRNWGQKGKGQKRKWENKGDLGEFTGKKKRIRVMIV